MDKSQIIALYEQDQRKDLAYPNTRREITPSVVRHLNASDRREGFISYSHLDEANADDMIREQVRYFESIGQDFEWKLYDYDQPSDLKERLRSTDLLSKKRKPLWYLPWKMPQRFYGSPSSIVCNRS